MQQSLRIKRITSALAAVTFLAVCVLAATQPVGARSNIGERRIDPAMPAEIEHMTEVHNGVGSENDRLQKARQHAAELRAKAKKELKEKYKHRQQKSAEMRRLVCEKRQKTIENAFTKLKGAADKHLEKLNAVFDRLQQYQLAEAIYPAGYDTLLADAVAKRSAATDAVAALKLVAETVDCGDPEVVVRLTQVRAAVKQARTALFEYRAALKEMVVALAKAKAADTNGNTTRANAAGSVGNVLAGTDTGASLSRLAKNEGVNR
ncbi:hypothetical protein CSA80_00475 [Candidatus Saccharibacteria bacterium]|nr:MAG: hypothetical protein CR973_00755 [Candidatus Saccharibacteria bacterium]PID99232.1 MAG: hypothetical protein CSA80_00475 [Candidatus Saccharibacteria bacterium]